MNIEPGHIQTLRYGGGAIEGRCRSGGNVIVFFQHFVTSTSKDGWNNREFLLHPERATLVEDHTDQSRPSIYKNS